MITLKELSEKCGVSIATISNVMNGKKNVSEKTRKIVMDAVKETGYQPNFMASSLRSQRTKTIGLIIEEMNTFSSPKLVEGIMAFLEEQNYRCILENLRFYSKGIIEETEEFDRAVFNAIRLFQAVKVDGIIYVAAHTKRINCIPEDLQVPCVVAYAKCMTENCPSVMIADEKAAYDMTSYIMKKGWKKTGMICGNIENLHTTKRVEGYSKALKDNNMEFDPELVVYGNWERETGYNYAKQMIEKGIDSVFCANDLIAAGFCDYLREINKVPGKDFGVAGFDNRSMSEFMSPKLTTVKLPLVEIGKKAAELILDKLADKALEQNDYEEKCSILERETV